MNFGAQNKSNMLVINIFIGTYFTCCSGVFTVNFENAIAGFVISSFNYF